jgi:hypothetical protein
MTADHQRIGIAFLDELAGMVTNPQIVGTTDDDCIGFLHGTFSR